MSEFPVRLSVQVDRKTADALTARAHKMERSVSYLIRAALKEYLERAGTLER